MKEEKENVQKLTDEELDLVTGGTQAETQEFCYAFIDYLKRTSPAVTQQDVVAWKKLPLEQLVGVVEDLAKSGNYGNIVINLYTDGRANTYSYRGFELSQKDMIDVLQGK